MVLVLYPILAEMRQYHLLLSFVTLVTAGEPESILGKRGRPVYFEDEKPTRAAEIGEYRMLPSVCGDARPTATADRMGDDEDVLPIQTSRTETQSLESQKALYTLLSLVPDSSLEELRQGMQFFSLSHSDETLIGMYEEASRPTEASDDFVQLLFREANSLTSPAQLTFLSERLAPFYSAEPAVLYTIIELWLAHCVNPSLELQKLYPASSISMWVRPCYPLPSGRWTLSDNSKRQYFGQRLMFLQSQRSVPSLGAP